MQPVQVHQIPFGVKVKQIHFLRHAHGKHNEVGEVDYTQYQREDLVDAELTELGIQQCLRLKESMKPINPQLIVTSPMRRTLQTAVNSFPHLIESIPWIALECIREQTGFHPCDKRFPISHHRENYPFIDFGEIEHEDDPLYHLYEGREPNPDLDDRARQFLAWLEKRPESEILVVTHAAFLRGLIQRVLFPNGEMERFDNCEIRSFVLYYPHE